MNDVLCEVFTPLESRTITGLTRDTLTRMSLKGEIRCGILPDGSRRYWREDIVRLAEKRQMTIKAILRMERAYRARKVMDERQES